MKHTFALVGVLAAGLSFPALADITVDAELPAGNIVFSGINGSTVSVNPDLRDTQGDWFYWAMRVRGAVFGPRPFDVRRFGIISP